MLELPNQELFTGHCWRRTAVTNLANKGHTLPQIKAVTGHESDTVVQGYIEKSATELPKTAKSMAIETPQSKRLPTEESEVNEESFASVSKKRPRMEVPSYPQQLPFVINFNVGSVLGACFFFKATFHMEIALFLRNCFSKCFGFVKQTRNFPSAQ